MESNEIHLPAALGVVVGHDGSQDHQFGAAAFEQSDLILLAQGLEGGQLFRHFDDAPDRHVGQVDDVQQSGIAASVVLQL